MKKPIAYFILGASLTALISFGPTSYAAVKQFVLTEFSGKVVANGEIYKDPNNPILNYNGKTYVPLAKVGELTGVQVKWDAKNKQVLIDAPTESYTIIKGQVRNADAVLAEEEAIKEFVNDNPVVIEEQSGLVKENGEIVLYVKDNYGTKKRYTNSDDTDYVIAKIKKVNPLPPAISDGWISSKMLKQITGSDTITNTNVQQKQFNNITYFNIGDLFKVGILK